MTDKDNLFAIYLKRVHDTNLIIRKFLNTEDYIRHLLEEIDYYAAEFTKRSEETARAEVAWQDLLEHYKLLYSKYVKFTGKKISKQNQRQYDEIMKEHDKLDKLGARAGMRAAVNIVARRKKMTAKEEGKLYQRFKKRTNRRRRST
jgi:hypothetical protein